MSMKNITVTVSAETYRKARIWAAQRNTSLSKVVQSFLTDLPTLHMRRRYPTPETREALEAQLDPISPDTNFALSRDEVTPTPSDRSNPVKL
jgi:hypothetical protein